MAQLSSEQHAAVAQWAADGANLNDIQQRLKSEFNVNLTYLDARLLMLDLQVKIKDKPKPIEPAAEPTPAPVSEAAPSGVTVGVDEVTLPGAMISGRVTFSDGKTAVWFIDAQGRPGMKAPEPGYQPPPGDMPIFQTELDRVLSQAGF